jgi:proteasome beta subunit
LPGFRSTYQGSSFFELLKIDHPHLCPQFGVAPVPPTGTAAVSHGVTASIPHGTTVLAMKCAEGVLVAGDRLATENYRVASRDVQKVFPTDDHSLMAIAGAAGPCIEMARVLRVELEHYEKIEGGPLELEGKANKLSQMIRQNLPAAMQGLVVVPIFAGYDRRRGTGRLWKYDVTGGRYEEAEFEATGSGSLYARESLKKSWRPGIARDEALYAAVQALVDAADEDRGTGGIDVLRGIYPTIYTCNAQGIQEVSNPEIAEVHRRVMEARASRGSA